MDRDRDLPGAVILGGSFHSLGAARNLSQHGVPVCVVDGGVCVSRFSNSVSSFITCPSADDDEEYVQFLLSTAADRDLSGWVLFPSTDETVRILAQHRDPLLERYRVTTPQWNTVKYLYDKRLTRLLAVERDVPVPETWIPGNGHELENLGCTFPVVVKPAISKHFMAATKKKAYRADSIQELTTIYETVARIMDPSEILVQELIPGGAQNLYSFVGFFENGNPVAGLAARRPRQHPMEFGRASTYVETVDIPELEALSTQLLTGIGYTGLAEVEFMFDANDGRFEFLEVNARIWGWHTFAIHAGLDLLYLAYAHAVGEDFHVGPARQGTRWVRLVTDLPTAISEILAGRLTLRQYLATMSGDVEFAVFSLRDPLPFLADLILAPYNYFTNRGF